MVAVLTDLSLNPFALQTADKKSDKGVHAKLNRSAALLPASSPLPPNVLAVSATPVGMNPPEHLLTGTFLLPFGTPRPLSLSILGLAQRADRLTLLLDVVARGCESSQAVIKDGEKQTFLWRDELEICGEQQGSEWAMNNANSSVCQRRPCGPVQVPHDREGWCCSHGMARQPVGEQSRWGWSLLTQGGYKVGVHSAHRVHYHSEHSLAEHGPFPGAYSFDSGRAQWLAKVGYHIVSLISASGWTAISSSTAERLTELVKYVAVSSC